MDRGTIEWQSMGTVDADLSQAILKGVGGRAVNVRVGYREEKPKVLIRQIYTTVQDLDRTSQVCNSRNSKFLKKNNISNL